MGSDGSVFKDVFSSRAQSLSIHQILAASLSLVLFLVGIAKVSLSWRKFVLGNITHIEKTTNVAAVAVASKRDFTNKDQNDERIDEEQHLLGNVDEHQDNLGDSGSCASVRETPVGCKDVRCHTEALATSRAELSPVTSSPCKERSPRQSPSIVPALDLCVLRYSTSSPTSMECGTLRAGAPHKSKISPRLRERNGDLNSLDLQASTIARGLSKRSVPRRSSGKLCSCPELDSDQHRLSETLPIMEQPFVHLASSSGSLRKRRSTSNEPAYERHQRFRQPPASADESMSLEYMLIQCEKELGSLETRLLDLAYRDHRIGHEQQDAQHQNLKKGHNSQEVLPRHSSSSSTKLAYLAAWRTDCQDVLGHFEGLAADALQRGCDRNTPGAMDVFEQANLGVESLASLLHKCTNAEAEAAAPASCDALEWRLVISEATGLVEERKLRELVDRLQDVRHGVPCGVLSPATLLRFLRAQHGDIDKAGEMFRASIEWRSTSGVQQRLTEWHAEVATGSTRRARLVERYRVHCNIGKDRLGLPVMLFRWSVFDAAGLERELGAELMLDIIIGIHEQLIADMRSIMVERDANTAGALYIWDVGNYGRHGVPNYFSRMWALVRFLPKVARILEANYPEVVRKVMVIRCGPATKAIHRAAAPFMPAGTLAKCRLYGWRAEEWRRELEEEMPGSSLPPFLTRDDEVAIASAEPRGGLCPVGAAAAF